MSFDGLAMASALPSGMDEDRVAAMSAALLSLGEKAAQGLGRGDLSQVYVEAENGTVFLVSAEDEAVLVAVAARGAKAGLMLYEVRRAAAAVGAVLQEDADPVQEMYAAPTVPEPAYDRPVAPLQPRRRCRPERPASPPGRRPTRRAGGRPAAGRRRARVVRAARAGARGTARGSGRGERRLVAVLRRPLRVLAPPRWLRRPPHVPRHPSWS